jgi:hypothetical protein
VTVTRIGFEFVLQGMKTRRLILAAAIAAAPLALAVPDAHAVTAEACSGAVLYNVSFGPSGYWSIAPLAYACDGGLNQVYALGSITGSSFSGDYRDATCTGHVQGVAVGTGTTGTLNGTISATCGSTGGLVGTFSASGTFPAGTLTVVIG